MEGGWEAAMLRVDSDQTELEFHLVVMVAVVCWVRERGSTGKQAFVAAGCLCCILRHRWHCIRSCRIIILYTCTDFIFMCVECGHHADTSNAALALLR
jgi:hypothetical protein